MSRKLTGRELHEWLVDNLDLQPLQLSNDDPRMKAFVNSLNAVCRERKLDISSDDYEVHAYSVCPTTRNAPFLDHEIECYDESHPCELIIELNTGFASYDGEKLAHYLVLLRGLSDENIANNDIDYLTYQMSKKLLSEIDPGLVEKASQA